MRGGPRPWGTSEAFGTITMAGRDHSLLSLFCRPVTGGVWEMKLTSGFGAYAFCLVQSVLISLFDIKLLLFVVYRICASITDTHQLLSGSRCRSLLQVIVSDSCWLLSVTSHPYSKLCLACLLLIWMVSSQYLASR